MATHTIISTIIAIGVGTYLTRLSFIWLADRVDKFAHLQKALKFVPVAVLPAIVMPALLCHDGALDISPGNGRLVGGVVAILVARLTKNVLWTTIAGMGTLWLIQAIAG
jgi:branched-subunit amino acid transport protein